MSIEGRKMERKITARNSSDINEVPDGGWGWMVVLAVFVGNLLIDGVVGCFGLLYPEILKEFKASPSVTSLAGSTVVGIYLFSSLLWGGCIRIYGCRVVCFTGGCICALGFALSMFSQTILTFLLTYGVLGGIGFGMNSISGHIIVNSYFNKRRGIAQGIVSSGAGAGVFLIAPLKQNTLLEYGWRGTMLIFAGIVLHFCVCACIMRPYKYADKNDSMETESYESPNGENIFDTNVDKNLNGYSEALLLGKNQSNNTDSNTCFTERTIYCEKLLKANGEANTCLVDEKGMGKFEIRYSKSVNGFLTPVLNGKHKRNRNNNKQVPDDHKHGLRDDCFNVSSLPNLTNRHIRKDKELGVQVRSQDFDPFKRKDILYSGSLCQLGEFQKADDIRSFVESMTMFDENANEHNLYCKRAIDNTCLYGLKVLTEHLCDFTVFRNKLFIPILIGAIFTQMGQFIPNTYIAEYGYSINLDENQMSVIVAIYGISNIFGRLSAGCLANVHCINPLWLCNFGTFMCGVACVVFPLCKTFAALSFFAVAQGYFIGYFAPLQILILVKYLGLDKLTSSVGFMQMAKGPAAIAGPPLAGLVYEWTKNYGTAVQFAGLLSITAALVQSVPGVFNRCSDIQSSHQKATKGFEIVVQADETRKQEVDERNSLYSIESS